MKQHLISDKATVKELLIKLEEIKGFNKTLFVLNENKELIGTITDGDIRRGLIQGLKMTDTPEKFMNTKYQFIRDKNDPFKIKRLKENRMKLVPLLDKDNRIIKIYDITKRKALLPIDAVLMAGGKGKRLRPLTDNIPKPLLPLGEKPLIEHNIDLLISYGIENIYISINYLGEQIIDYFGDGSSKGINIKYIKEDKPLGTAGSLGLFEASQNKYILLMNSDLFTDVDIYDLYFEAVNKKAAITISSIPYTINVPFAIFNKSDNKIIGLEEKPQINKYANAGIYLIETEILDIIPKNNFYDTPDLILDVIKRGKKVIDCPITGYWIDIGRHEEYNKAKEIIKHLKND